MSFLDSTKVVNTAACWEYHGAFTVTLSDAHIPELPLLRGALRVGNLLHIYRGLIRKPYRPDAPTFRITVNGCFSFSIPAEAVACVEDANRKVICEKSTS